MEEECDCDCEDKEMVRDGSEVPEVTEAVLRCGWRTR